LTQDIDRSWEALKNAENPRIHTFIATSDIHMQYKLKMSKEDVLERARSMVAYAKKLCSDIEFSAEDASRSDPEFLYRVFETVINAGATVINIPDTVGYTTPDEFFALIKGVRENVPNIDKAIISVHCHNDLGMAVANTLAAARAGATQLECTINGIGERAGNAALEEVIMAIKTRPSIFNLDCRLDTTHIHRSSRLISSITGVSVFIVRPLSFNISAPAASIREMILLASVISPDLSTPFLAYRSRTVI
jgi:2-isopropylmalate synthase